MFYSKHILILYDIGSGSLSMVYVLNKFVAYDFQEIEVKKRNPMNSMPFVGCIL